MEIEDTFKRLFDPEEMEEQIRRGHEIWLKEEKENPNNFSYWYDKIKHIPGVPKSIILKFPDWMLDALVSGNVTDRDMICRYFERYVTPIVINELGFKPFKNHTIFMKNGCFSDKFDFNNSCKIEEITTENIVNHFLNLEYDALMYETYGDLELVFREYIWATNDYLDEAIYPTIYNGMPLRVELRAFYDFDKNEYLYDNFYWDWDYCYDNLPDEDKETFEKEYKNLYDKYLAERANIQKFLEENLKDVDLRGIWSVDVLVDANGNYRLIDMAIAERSAYWDINKLNH